MLTNNKLKICSLAVVFVFLFSSVGLANLSAKTIGLGDSFVTITGADALYGNPAAVNADQEWFALELSGGAEAWNNLLVNDYIEDGEKDDLLNKISDSGFIVRPAGRGGLKLLMGPVAAGFDMRADGMATLSQDAAELLLKGNEIDQSYSLDGSAGVGSFYGDASLNVSLLGPDQISLPTFTGGNWQLKDVYVGFTYHQLLGGVVSKLEGDGDVKLGYNDEGNIAFSGNGELTMKYNKPDEGAGLGDLASGSAIDLGVYTRINDTYNVGFSAMNIGSLSTKASNTYYQKYKGGSGDNADVESTEEELLGESITWQLPTTYRFGGKMDFNEDVDFFADYSYTAYHLGGGFGEHKFSAAAEATWLDFLPLRTGLNYSTLRNDFAWSTGLGVYLGPVKAEVGMSDLLGLFKKSRGMKGAATLKIEF